MEPRPLAEQILDAAIWTFGLAAGFGMLLAFGRAGIPLGAVVAVFVMLRARPLAQRLHRWLGTRGAPRARFAADTPAWERTEVLLIAARTCLARGALDDAEAFVREALHLDRTAAPARALLAKIAARRRESR